MNKFHDLKLTAHSWFKSSSVSSPFSIRKSVLYIYFVIFMSCFNNAYASEKIEKKQNSPRDILTKLRGGDYAHAGDKEAIDFVLAKLASHKEKIENGNILDLGSGYGGTADYLYKKGFRKIWGIDHDKNAVKYASSHYKAIKFFPTDAMNLTERFRKDFFSFVYMFNVAYAIPDKASLIRNISKTSEPGAILAVFDYSKLKDHVPTSKKDKPEIMKDLAGNIMHPIEVAKFNSILKKQGWKILISEDISKEYIDWYEKFLQTIISQRTELLKMHKGKDIEKLANLFNRILFNLKNGSLGGCLIIAEKL